MSVFKIVRWVSLSCAFSLGLFSCKTTQTKIVENKVEKSVSHVSKSDDRYVVVLSMDGFRADYVTKTKTPNLDAMMSEGTWGVLRPSFPTLTFPNHYAMATGLYPNNNGLVANEFWSTKLGHYKLGDMKSVSNPIFYNGEPVWNTAKRQGIKTASYFWVGSETAVGGSQPDIWKSYDGSVKYEARADSVIKWLGMPQDIRPRLIMWYIDEPDHTGHDLGAESPKTWEMATRCDSVVGYFRNKLSSLPIADKVDFIVVSDHGMANFYADKVVNVTDYIPEEWIENSYSGPFAMVYIKEGFLDKAYDKLKEMPRCRVFKKGDLPERLHYGSAEQIGDIVILADMGTFVYTKKGQKPKDGGAHGYDNAWHEMYAVFRAVGPHFRKNYEVKDPIPNITLYPMICNILNIEQAKNDADDNLAKSLVVDIDKK